MGRGAKIRVSCKVRALSKALCVLHLIREFVCVCVYGCVYEEREKGRERQGGRERWFECVLSDLSFEGI